MEYYTPREYQVHGERHLLENKAAGLWFDMGLGKTSVALSAFKLLRDIGEIDCMVVVGTVKIVQTVWPNEIKKWIDFHDITYTILQGPNRASGLLEHADIYLVNYENLDWFVQQSTWVGVSKRKIICFDELAKMSNWSAQRVKTMRHIGKKGFPMLALFERRWGLTGTPMTNGYEQLFSQTYMLDMGERLGHSLEKYRANYFMPAYDTQKQRKLVLRYGAKEEISDLLSDLYLRMDGVDWLELPKEIYNRIELELPSDLQDWYAMLEQDFLFNLTNEIAITATSASSRSTKLRQFLSGRIYEDDGSVHFIHNIKYNAVDEFLDLMNGKPVLIGYVFKHEAEEIKRRHKDAVLLDGNMSAAKAAKIVADFNAGKIAKLLGHPKSIGHGLNLQEGCSDVLFFGYDFNLGDTLQFIKRVARSGQQEKSVVIHSLHFPNTIESHIIATLEEKKTEQEWLLNRFR